jgi:hypothetical protein
VSYVLHIVAARMKHAADDAARERALELAHGLGEADGVAGSLVASSEQWLITATWLSGREALEPFAASPQHMTFIMRGLAHSIEGIWSASVETAAAPQDAGAVAMWAFALGAAEGAYEWQVRDLLDRIERLPGVAAAGPTVEERERYRAAGVVCLRFPEVGPFEAALAEARLEWDDLAASIETASAPVSPGPPG